MNTLTVRLVAIAALLITGAWGGWLVSSGHYLVQIADLKRSSAEQNERTAKAASSALQAATERGNALAARVSAAETALQTQSLETTHEVIRLTTGRPCLGSAAVRLLNNPARLKPAAVPQAASQPAEPAAAFASDTDVALWADAARRGYDTCRGRLQAVADFFAD